jgi:hypothetical protein
MLRDNKRLPLSDLSSVVPTFLLLIFIIIPIWLTILLPITLFYQLIKFIYKKCTMMLITSTTTVRKSTDPRVSSSRSGSSNHGHIQKQQNEMYQNNEYKSSSNESSFSTKHPSSSPSSSSPTTIKATFPSVDHSTRPCDIIIYGASGFTGYSPTLSSS